MALSEGLIAGRQIVGDPFGRAIDRFQRSHSLATLQRMQEIELQRAQDARELEKKFNALIMEALNKKGDLDSDAKLALAEEAQSPPSPLEVEQAIAIRMREEDPEAFVGLGEFEGNITPFSHVNYFQRGPRRETLMQRLRRLAETSATPTTPEEDLFPDVGDEATRMRNAFIRRQLETF